MIRLCLILFAAFATPALADVVRVTSGEHDGFTRLVFDYGRPVDWQVGRSDDGYELQVAGEKTVYDLQQAFDLIGKSRLSAIWVQPDTGELRLGLACACHAIPFEFRPGIVVIDLKDGAPPKGSAFELALDGQSAEPLAAPPLPRPKPRPAVGSSTPYEWTEVAYANLRSDKSAGQNLPAESKNTVDVLPADLALQPLRDDLLRQLSRGAAQGVIDFAKPNPAPPRLGDTTFPSAQIRIGNEPGSVNKADTSVSGVLGAKGTVCVEPESLALQDWGDETLPLVDQLATAKTNLSGEFDRPDKDAITRAVRFLLFLGFGAEARQTLAAFEAEGVDAKPLNALGYILDGVRDPTETFKDQAACDGPAALWAVLSDESLTKGDPINTGAVRLALSALPSHLRRLVGPRLTEKFLSFDDEKTARAVTDATLRAPGQPDGKLDLMGAGLDLHMGDAAEAESKAAAVAAESGPNQTEALITLTEARIAQGLPMSAEVASALQSQLADHAGTEIEPRLQEALTLAEAASGDFAAAFERLTLHPKRQDDVWALTVALAPDDTFLAYAVLDPSVAPPAIPSKTASAIARRLTSLGLAAPAQLWLAQSKNPDPLLVADAAIKMGDGRKALNALAGIEGDVANALKLQALDLLGEAELRADLLTQTAPIEVASAAQARAADWAQLSETGVEPWKALAKRLTETPTAEATAGPAAPLARGHELVAAGAATRTEIDALLAAVSLN